MKKSIIAIVMLLFVFTLVACGSPRQEGVLTIWWPGGSPAERAAIDRAKELYEDENPEVTINIVPQATSNFYMDYMISLNGNNYPDIAYVDHVYIQQLVYNEALADLSAYGIEDIQDTFIESLWAPNTYEGSVYALPFSANVLTTVYNKTLLETVLGRALEASDIPDTYDDLLEISALIMQYNIDNGLTGDNAYTPYTIPAGNTNESMGAMAFLSYVAREGGQIISDDLKTMQLDQPAALAAATKIKEIGDNNYSNAYFEEGRFEAGRIGFIEMGPWKMHEYERIGEQRSIEFGYAPIIKLNESMGRESALGLYSLVVTDQSINRDLAVDFIRFIATNDELQLLHNTAQNLMPTTKAAIEDDFYSGDIWDVYIEQLNSVVARPGSPEWSEMERQLANFVTSLLNGTRNPEYVYSLNIVLQNTLDEIYG